MTIGVPVAVDPVALLDGAPAALALVLALGLVLTLVLLPLALLQAAPPATSPAATHPVIALRYFIPASWGIDLSDGWLGQLRREFSRVAGGGRLLCVEGEDLVLVEFARGGA